MHVALTLHGGSATFSRRLRCATSMFAGVPTMTRHARFSTFIKAAGTRLPSHGMTARLVAVALLLCAPVVGSQQGDGASVAHCEQTLHADAGAALSMANDLLGPLEAQREPGAYFEALGCKAWALAMLGRSEEAITLAAQMADAAPAVESLESRVRVLRRAASVHQSLDRFEPAVQLLGEAMRLAEREGLQGLRIEVMTNLAVLHSSANQFEQAIAHLERALELALATEDRRRELPVRFNLGQTYRSAKRYEEAAAALEPLLPALEAPGMESRLAALLASLGWLRSELGEVEAAERHFTRAAALLDEGDNAAELTVVLNGQARLLLLRGEVQQATSLAERALAIARQSGDFTSVSSSLTGMVEVLEAQNRYAEAMKLLRERGELDAEHISQQQRSRLNELEVQLGVERQARELDQLRQERERQSMAMERQRLNLLLALAAVALGIAALIWQRTTNRRLHRLSRTDQLTGLLNRRGLTEAMERPGEGAGMRLVLLVDIDHFKSINDRFGHAVGDRVLVALAETLRGVAQRHAAKVARWGGEEFAVLAHVADAQAAADLARDLGLAAVAARTSSENDGPIDVSVSVGFAPLPADAEPGCAWQQTLLTADELLYRAKHAGRNRGIGVWPCAPGTALRQTSLDAMLASGAWRLLEVAYRPGEAVA